MQPRWHSLANVSFGYRATIAVARIALRLFPDTVPEISPLKEHACKL
jgi:hypothetical protein